MVVMPARGSNPDLHMLGSGQPGTRTCGTGFATPGSRFKGGTKFMKRKLVFMVLLALVAMVPTACQSLNQVTPEELDDAAIEAEVRAKIAEDVPSKTFAVEVAVNDGVVTLSGHAANATERTAIARDRKSTRLNSSHGYISYA